MKTLMVLFASMFLFSAVGFGSKSGGNILDLSYDEAFFGGTPLGGYTDVVNPVTGKGEVLEIGHPIDHSAQGQIYLSHDFGTPQTGNLVVKMDGSGALRLVNPNGSFSAISLDYPGWHTYDIPLNGASEVTFVLPEYNYTYFKEIAEIPSPVPEPSSVVLLGVGLLFAAYVVRKKVIC